jgi:hypothetical protein
MSCEKLTLEMIETSSEWSDGNSFELRLTGVRNSPLAGFAGDLFVETLSASGRLAGRGVAVNELSLDARTVAVECATSTLLTNRSASLTCDIQGFNLLPPNASLTILLPDAFTVPSASFIGLSASSTTPGTYSISFESRQLSAETPLRSSRNPTLGPEISGNVSIMRTGDPLPRSTVWGVALQGLMLREYSGVTAPLGFLVFSNDAGRARLIEKNLSATSFYLRYAPPSIQSFSRRDIDTRGGTRITISGAGYGSVRLNDLILDGPESRAAAVGSSQCLETLWTSDSALLCVSPPGDSHNLLTLSVTIESQHVLSTGSLLVTYLAPLIDADFTANLAPRPTSLLLLGEHFAAYDLSLAARA